MLRLWLGVGAVAACLMLWFLFQAAVVVVAFAAIAAGGWIWWEVHALRKAMRTPPKG